MSNQTTTFETIFDDIKSSFRGAKDNVLSYFLAHLGMIVVTTVLIALVAIPFGIAVFLAGPAAWQAWADGFASLATSNPWAISVGGYFMALPFLAVLFMVIGSMYGMSKEVVTTGKTSAESAFSWLRNNFLTFAGAGIILSLIVILPQILIVATVYYFVGYAPSIWVSYGVSVFVFIYSFITLGLTSMALPAVVNGKGVQEAFFESFKLATQRFDRVFGVHTAIVLIGLLSIAPFLSLAGWAAVVPPTAILVPAAIALGFYAIAIGILWIFFLIPMIYIAYVRVYNDLTGGEIAETSVQTPEVPMV